MNEEIRWLVITPTLGTSPYLSEAIASICHLPGKVEHIIVCPSDARDVICSRNHSSRVICEPINGPKGMYAAISVGLRAATIEYDFFCYLNDDDYFLPGISKVAEILVKNEHVIYYGITLMVNKNSEALYQYPYAVFPKFVPIFFKHGITPFMQPSMIVSRLVIEHIGEFDKDYRYCGDLDFILRAISQGTTFKLLEYRTAAFRLHNGQLSSSRSNMEQEKFKAYKRVNFENPSRKLWLFLLKFIMVITNIRSYIDRLIKLKALTSEQAFYESKVL